MSWEEMDDNSRDIASWGSKIKEIAAKQAEDVSAAGLRSQAGEEYKAGFERLDAGLQRHKNCVEGRQNLSPQQMLESQALRLPKGEVPAFMAGAESMAMRVAAARIGLLNREGREDRERIERRRAARHDEHIRRRQDLAREFAAGRREMRNCGIAEDGELL